MNDLSSAKSEPASIVDSLDNHMAAAGSIDRAALLPGMYLGWCVRLGLVTPVFKSEHEVAVLRLNYGEGSGVELLVSCGGTFQYSWLTAQGQAFTRSYYGRYPEDWRAVFGDELYSVADSWTNYDLLAPVLTRAFYAFSGTASAESRQPGSSARGSKRSRWKFWR